MRERLRYEKSSASRRSYMKKYKSREERLHEN